MRCEKCGKETSEGKFCMNCGSPLVNTEKEDEAKKSESKVNKIFRGDRIFRHWIWSILVVICGLGLILGGSMNGIIVLAGGVVLTPKVLNKFEGKKKVVAVVIALVLVMIGLG